MPSPIMDDIIEFDDGTEATLNQISKDVTSFLLTAEPELEKRKSLGLKTIFFLVLLTIYAAWCQKESLERCGLI